MIWTLRFGFFLCRCPMAECYPCYELLHVDKKIVLKCSTKKIVLKFLSQRDKTSKVSYTNLTKEFDKKNKLIGHFEARINRAKLKNHVIG